MSDFRRVEKSLAPDEVIVGFFHTHLPHHTANPSKNDYEGAKVFPEFLNLIYKPDTGEIAWYRALTLEES
jgi:proteasome lid subunit RPN8/RPN11